MNNKRYDFRAIGRAIKAGRNNKGITREKAVEVLGITVRSLAEIENKGQHPRFQTFYTLVTMTDVSVDEFFYPELKADTTSARRQVNKMLDGLTDRELSIIEATIEGIYKARETENE